MCGIAGLANAGGRPIELDALGRMAAAIRHRGPDGYGYLLDGPVGLAHNRLSIIDIAGGDQPLAGCDERCWITFNGEVYNYIELRAELQVRGHRFRTASDTEVIVHAYEEWGLAALDRLNGQFAFALYDRRDHSLLLARDRFGVRPLFYTRSPAGDLAFASEAKALFAADAVQPAIDPIGLEQVFRFWSARAPRTVFRDVAQLEPGAWARWHDDGRFETGRWWQPAFAEGNAEPADAIAQLDALMRESVALRMRADVPVGAYLSGGLDSSITCALATKLTPHQLRTFSVSFADPLLDESVHQLSVAAALNSAHAVQRIAGSEIACVFPDVVRHAETPMLRTAPAPLYLLARLARERGITVVLTGEGSDEVFLGYTLFQEAAVRRFCLRQPASTRRPQLFDRLYPWMPHGGGEMWRRFFLDAGPPDDPLFSHLPRFRLGAFLRAFHGPALIDGLRGVDIEEDLRASLPDEFHRWSHPHQAAWLEMTTLLDGYLLSSQGDRMAMAHGVEGRFPFLDHRLFAFAAALPARNKLRGLEEKAILRRWSQGLVPEDVRRRPKQPYRAPDAPAFFGPGAPPYVEELLSDTAIRATGLFAPEAVAGLIRRCRAGRVVTTRENQAVVGILSAQIWHRQLIEGGPKPVPLDTARANVTVNLRD
jgi:asparagine synthase (glutamine-hydrolysing)